MILTRNKWCFILFLLFSSLLNAKSAPVCPDIHKAKKIGKELVARYQVDVCAKGIKAEQIRWIKERAVPRLMTKDFLGVEPPLYWEIVADELFRDCSPRSNLCQVEAQKELAQCLTAKLPTFLLVFGTWFTDHCEDINQAIIQNWESKRPIIDDLVNQFSQAAPPNERTVSI
jgi:hypothetical protein